MPYNKRGRIYDANSEYDLAIADLDEAIRLNPNQADFYYNRGNVYNDKGEYELATKDYDKAAKLERDCSK